MSWKFDNYLLVNIKINDALNGFKRMQGIHITFYCDLNIVFD